MRPFKLSVLMIFAVSAPVYGQSVSIPQVDRGPAVALPQFQTAPAPHIRQLPETARVRAQPVATRIVEQPVIREFLVDLSGAGVPQNWSEVDDEEPVTTPDRTGEATPSVGTGVTVILTPRAELALPSVGAGAVAVAVAEQQNL